MANAEKLPFSKVVLFALGQLGWSLCSFGVGNLMNNFYMPAESKDGAAYPSFIYQGSVLGILTVIGLVTALARLFDAVTNPLIANWSDRSTSKLGRRTFFMAISAVPFALTSILVFVPIVPRESPWNIAWLSGTILVFYFFFVAYTTPYTALISEYGHTDAERLNLSTALSITWALGFAVGQGTFAFEPLVASSFGLSKHAAFQAVMGAFALVSLVCMLLPVFFIRERRYAEPRVSKENVREALHAAFTNKQFVRFALSDLTYWIAATFIQLGMVYYMTTLLHPNDDFEKDKSLVTPVMAVLFVTSFLFYVPVNVLSRKIGKKRVMLAAFVLLSLVFVGVASMGSLPLPRLTHAYALAVFAAVPMAIFGILPNVIISDLAEADGRKTGSHKAGIFFGTRTFLMNVGIAVANMLFSSFLLLGKSVANPLGVRLTSFAAIGFCLIGLVLFSLYDEKAVLADLAKDAEDKPASRAASDATPTHGQ